jgi:signal transduction histidine kinase
MITLGLGFAAAAPFYFVALPVITAFVPVIHAIVCVTGLIAAAFLFSRYSVQRQPAFLLLASGYLLAGLLALLQSLASPGAYSASGLFSAGAAAWLFLAWHTSFPLGIVAYALARHAPTTSQRSAAMTIAATIACTILTICTLVWIVTAADQHLPVLFIAITLSLMATLLLTAGGRTTLDLWLVVTVVAALPDIAVPVSNYAVGFYLARGCEMISSCAVLIALLTESSILYARLASAKALQVQGETERLNSLETATAAIAHELRQPLSAIRIHAQACVTLLSGPSPALKQAEAILSDIDKDACRAADMLERIRGGLHQQELVMEVLDLNILVTEAIKLVSDDAAARGIAVSVNLSNEYSYAPCDRTQITQVLLNLLTNGMDAMDMVPAAERKLTLTVLKRDGMVVTSVKDKGCGISPDTLPRIFEPFFTTRRDGMGLGLSISRSIIVAHKGDLWVENSKDRGAIFCFSLPAWEQTD